MEMFVCSHDSDVLSAIKQKRNFTISPSITQLNLEGNKIGAEGARYLAAALEKNSSITQLSLARNNMGDKGAQYLAAALEKNSSITDLDLRNNNIGDEGAQYLATVLEKNSSITDLDLRSNKIGAEGAQYLASIERLLKQNQNMTKEEKLSHFKANDKSKDPQIELEALHRLVLQNNWDGVATVVQNHSKLPIESLLPADDSNLNTKAFMTQLLAHTFKQLTTNLNLDHQHESVKHQELDKQKKALQDEVDALKRKLQEMESKLSTVDLELKDSSTKVEELSMHLTTLNKNLTKAEQLYSENATALKAWQERLQVPHQWTIDDVALLLKDIGMKKHIKVFAENKIDGRVLFDLSTTDLMGLSLTFIESKRMQKALYLISHYKDLYISPPGLLQWSNETVCMWLEDNKYSHLVPVFKQLQITGSELAFIDRQDLKEHMKVKALGDCISLEKAIKQMFQNDMQEQHEVKKLMAKELNEEAIAEQQSKIEFKVQELQGANEELRLQLKSLKSRAPEAFCCPITGEVMESPVVASDGHTYERSAIENWLFKMNKDTSPMTNEKLKSKELIASHTLKSMIREWVENNQKA
eukprot:TRINITY_DN1793_c0_g1_i4.p1 TRINITY_DN1793_c0_g1~~TRINITY_DN1793_c0_g1_i4.p1  ORF type:complete len:603 (-),score=117.67 TRINITY_DN1793_c0_g1_i4:86-1840(-)